MKKIHRFLIRHPVIDPSVVIEDADLVHLIKNVLKLTTGEECIVFPDGGDDHLTSIKTIEKSKIILEVQSIIPKKVVSKDVTACVSITKRDNFEMVVQKLTELGIKAITPIISERTIKQALKIDRLQKISDEALEQSGGSFRVHISEPKTIEECLITTKETLSYCFDMDGMKLENTNDKELAFYIGPEGGWSDGDKELFKKYNTKVCMLGETTLRAETAAIVAGYKLLWD